MFEELPETIPLKNPKRRKAIVAAAGIHVVLVATIILVQMVMPEKIGEFQLLTTLYMAPPPPPPAPLGPPPETARVERKAPVTSTARNEAAAILREEPPKPTVEEPALIAPTAIPKDIARINEVGPSTGGVIGGLPGVPGGVPGGTAGGVLGGILGGVAAPPAAPPPKEPVRVGGSIREPKIVKLVQPRYPPEAVRAHIEGTVLIEATVTERGTVEKVRVISGPQELQQAAIEAVQSWKYEPTVLNGQPVPVILTAKVNFSLANAGK